VLSLALLCCAGHGCRQSVAVTAIVEHPALDAIRDGVKDELKAEGSRPARISSGNIKARRAIRAQPRRSPASSLATSRM